MQRKLKFKNSNENKKVKNAKKIFYEGIEFKSKLELNFYINSKTSKIPFLYEQYKTILLEGTKLEGYIYQPNKSKDLVLNTTKIKNMTYTPDFHNIFKNANNEKCLVVAECKGIQTDSYKLKKKLFLIKMNKEWGQRFYFFEPHNIYQINQCLNIIKTEFNL